MCIYVYELINIVHQSIKLQPCASYKVPPSCSFVSLMIRLEIFENWISVENKTSKVVCCWFNHKSKSSANKLILKDLGPRSIPKISGLDLIMHARVSRADRNRIVLRGHP